MSVLVGSILNISDSIENSRQRTTYINLWTLMPEAHYDTILDDTLEMRPSYFCMFISPLAFVDLQFPLPPNSRRVLARYVCHWA